MFVGYVVPIEEKAFILNILLVPPYAVMAYKSSTTN